MAIQFARIEYGSRSTGANACRKAAYNARESIRCERTGQLFSFKHRTDNIFHAVLLPEGVDPKFKDSATLWNMAENAERRKDSQVYKECVIALPDDRIVTDEDRMEIAQRFANRVFVTKGLACQIDVHSPHEGEKNWHAHFIIATRRFREDGQAFSPYKARDTDPDVRCGKVVEGDAIGEIFAEIQNEFFKEKGYDLRVDPVSIVPQEHLGPMRMRQHMNSAMERAEMLRTANEAMVRSPEMVLKKLTEKQSTFTIKALDHFLLKHVDQQEIGSIREAVLSHKNILALYDPHMLLQTDRYTTTTVRREEEKCLRFAEAVYDTGSISIKEEQLQKSISKQTLNEEQAKALVHVTTAEGLSIIKGRAGVGKSHTLRAIRDVYQDQGYRVIGLAPTNTVVRDMAVDGFQHAYTVHSMLFRHKNNRFALDQNTVLLVDEAAMLGNSAYVELFYAAKSHKCKVILLGDNRQLTSVDRGGIYNLLAEKFGSAELTQVRRQSITWQKEVSEALGQGQVEQAVSLLSENKALSWSATKAEAMNELIKAWTQDHMEDPSKTNLILATRNIDVDALNTAVREIRLQRGEIAAQSYECHTQRGKEVFSVGDRVCFTETNKDLGIANGAFGYIESLTEAQCKVKLDKGAVEGRPPKVQFNPETYHGLKLGYAATIYKSQGKTLDQVYVLHGNATNSNTTYVALSRQTESLQVFANAQETQNENHLIAQMSRDEGKHPSLRYLTEDQANRAKTLGDGYRGSTFDWDAAKEVWTDFKTNVHNKLSDLLHDNPEFYAFEAQESKSRQPVREVDLSSEGAIEDAKARQQEKPQSTIPDASVPGAPAQDHVQPESETEHSTWRPMFPVPENVAKPDIENSPHLSHMAKDKKITAMHAYKDRKGSLLGYVVRLEGQVEGRPPVEGQLLEGVKTATLTYCEAEGRPTNDKQICLSQTSLEGRQQWRWQDFGERSPLYGQEKLIKSATKPVLVVEGEKTADAAQKLFPDHVVISWPGSAAAVERANWGPLLGRDVVIWPDNAESGLKAAQHIEGKLKNINDQYRLKTDITIVDLPKELPAQWNLVDEIPKNMPDIYKLVHKEQAQRQSPEGQAHQRPLKASAPQINDPHMAHGVHDYRGTYHKAEHEKPAHEAAAYKFFERYNDYQLDSSRDRVTKEQRTEFEKEVTSFMKNEKAVNHLKTIDSDIVKAMERLNKEIMSKVDPLRNLARTQDFDLDL